MKKLYWAALGYMALGLAAGLYFRELTRAKDFTGFTQASVMHTHLLALGMLVFLVLIALEKLLTLSASRAFTWFFWLYNVGLLLTVAMMGVHGTRTVLGLSSGAGVAGAAGLGHILLTAALASFFVALYRRLLPRGGDQAVLAGARTRAGKEHDDLRLGLRRAAHHHRTARHTGSAGAGRGRRAGMPCLPHATQLTVAVVASASTS